MQKNAVDKMDIAIARFMNMEGTDEFIRQNYQYHKSWELLMPVVEKISKIQLLNHDNTPCTDPRDVCHPITFAMPTEDGKQLMFRFKGFGLCMANTLIEAVHEACYEVAKYHNQQKQTNAESKI